MTEIFGDFIAEFPPEQDSLELTFTPSSLPIVRRWRNNRLSAHFIADYFSNFLPVNDDDPEQQNLIKQSKGAVIYVANELLENAMKFHEDDFSYKVKFGIHFVENIQVIAVILAMNIVKPEMADSFKIFIKRILSSDPKELYIQQIEKSAEAEDGSSGLGLLTMINDYGAKIGWKFETMPDNPDAIAVTTLVQIAI
ncbi:MAG TPA: ATP-binding protein [Cyanobacteria bacterium UBA11149]|nr:ATP-binding protein [Cyanobacteria bacterium UBA11367]HBE59493.1 ATP-binding protein [Cyanobacteria bacterium UBA11366]HBK66871.1 ATP-binding protein [Cyanobacteria bacterium UBA11166]HBR76840.1 ATP-binding protein [Cyanobacteria bacterium UBA11159]HBS72597.1 ATP-binding protein [Cyanobacteria bacterium UBA11153]HBW90753.1 ATP-binding protein [Cyanobacteria bacterium UBA11149]HCA93680.1 ATP-binding protein [Cyanobacteria bacterium UBA9226]